jgi:hypothetical protein
MDRNERIVLLEERALELGMVTEPGQPEFHELDQVRLEVRQLHEELRPEDFYGVKAMIRRLDAVVVALMCIRQNWAEAGADEALDLEPAA